MTLRDSFEPVSPPWLNRRVGLALKWTVGAILDGVRELVEQGVKARMPGVLTPQSLAAIGNDRLIDRGPTESDANYAGRLSSAFDTWRTAGNPHTLLRNLAAFFSPSPIPIRVVSDSGVWHEIDPTTGEITRTIAEPNNWQWDPYASGIASAPRHKRGWVILFADGRWTQWLVGDPNIYVGDGHTVGSTATAEEVASIRRIVRRFRPRDLLVVHIIVTFDENLFRPDDPPGAPMPDGDWDQYANRSTDAIYWLGVKD